SQLALVPPAGNDDILRGVPGSGLSFFHSDGTCWNLVVRGFDTGRSPGCEPRKQDTQGAAEGQKQAPLADRRPGPLEATSAGALWRDLLAGGGGLRLLGSG